MATLHERYAEIVDKVPVPHLIGRERQYVQSRLDGPTDQYMELVVALDEEGCPFPKTQAALMMLNTPGVAKKLLQERA